MAKNRIELTAPTMFLGPPGSEGGPEAIDAILAERRAKALERAAAKWRLAELERASRRLANERAQQIGQAVSKAFETIHRAAMNASPAYETATRAYRRMVERLAESVLGSGAIRVGFEAITTAAQRWAEGFIEAAEADRRSARVAQAGDRAMRYVLGDLVDVLDTPRRGLAMLVAVAAEWLEPAATAIAKIVTALPSGSDWTGRAADSPEKRRADAAKTEARMESFRASMETLRSWAQPAAIRAKDDVTAIILEIEASRTKPTGERTVTRGLVDIGGAPIQTGSYRALSDVLLGRYVSATVEALKGWTKSRAALDIADSVERILRDGSASLRTMAGQTAAALQSAVDRLRETGSKLLPVAEGAQGLASAFESAAGAAESIAASGGAFARFVARARLLYAAALASFNGALYAAKATASFATFDYARGSLYATAAGLFFGAAGLALGGAVGIVKPKRDRPQRSAADGLAANGRNLTLTVNGDVVGDDDEWWVNNVIVPITTGGRVLPTMRREYVQRFSTEDQVRMYARVAYDSFFAPPDVANKKAGGAFWYEAWDAASDIGEQISGALGGTIGGAIGKAFGF
jgi:hypothetical protein